MADDRDKAEELLQDSKDQTRHGAEAQSGSESGSEVDVPTLHEAIKDAHERLGADEMPENLTIRDKRLAALIRGLEVAGQLEDVAVDAGTALGRDTNDIRGTRAATLRLLVRVGLQEVAPGTTQTAIEARKEYLTDQADEF
jgi:hypothetical protein